MRQISSACINTPRINCCLSASCWHLGVGLYSSVLYKQPLQVPQLQRLSFVHVITDGAMCKQAVRRAWTTPSAICTSGVDRGSFTCIKCFHGIHTEHNDSSHNRVQVPVGLSVAAYPNTRSEGNQRPTAWQPYLSEWNEMAGGLLNNPTWFLC